MKKKKKVFKKTVPNGIYWQHCDTVLPVQIIRMITVQGLRPAHKNGTRTRANNVKKNTRVNDNNKAPARGVTRSAAADDGTAARGGR